MQRSIRIFYTNPITGLLDTRLADTSPEQILGVQLLLEKVAKLLFTATNSNFFSPELGSAIGNRYSINNSDRMLMEIALHDGVKSVETQLLAEQAAEGTNLDPEQTLVSLEISNIFQGDDLTQWYVEVIVRTQMNQSFFLTV
jgi:hypothetical protein